MFVGSSTLLRLPGNAPVGSNRLNPRSTGQQDPPKGMKGQLQKYVVTVYGMFLCVPRRGQRLIRLLHLFLSWWSELPPKRPFFGPPLSPTLQLSLRKLDQLRTNKEREVGRLLESRGMRADYDDGGGGRGVCSPQEKEIVVRSNDQK